jgi:rhodanese-related sulfurtransferase
MTTSLNVLANLRDLGGLPTSGGGRTRSGVLYRSALPIVDDDVPTEVPVWPAHTVIDLRSPKEQVVTEHPLLAEHTNIHRVSLLSDADVAGQHLLTGLDRVYDGIVSNAGRQLAQVFTLAATEPGPVLLHCAAGKDRTGIATAMLLHAAGVDTAHVVADYTATERHMESVLARIRHTDPSFAQGIDMYNNDLARAVPETIGRVLAQWDVYPGGIHGWVRDRGVEPAVIDRWRERFVAVS